MATRNLIRLALADGGVADVDRARHLRHRVRRWSEWLLIAAGVLFLSYYLYGYGEARLYQSIEDRELDQILNSVTATRPDAAPQRTVPAGTTVGRIEIPRLGISAVIRAGTDARTLRLAVGYIPGTALPGDTGNIGLAAHRDTFFRKLRDVNPDDEIRIVTKDGVFHYHVQRTSIVMPEDVWVLDPTNYPALTLVTCYPFNYIGSAPQRFIVRAALAAPEASARVNPLNAATSPPSQPAASIVRTPIAKRTVAARTKVSKLAHAKASIRTKRSKARGRLVPLKTTTRSTAAKRTRTTDTLRPIKSSPL